jgi:hypothetical protein
MNSACTLFGARGTGNLRFQGYSGKGRSIRMIKCQSCGTLASERKGTALSHCKLPEEKIMTVLEHIREGCGTRSTSRLTGVDKDTVTRYVAKAGEHAKRVHDEWVAFSPEDPRSSVRREVELCRKKGKTSHSRRA